MAETSGENLGKACGARQAVTSLRTPPPANPKPTRVGKRGPGGEAPWRGVVGGVPPQNQKRGRVALLSNLPTSGTQSASEPLAHGGGQRGWRGRSPLPGGLGDVPPRTLRRGRAAPISNPAHEWDPKRWQTLS